MSKPNKITYSVDGKLLEGDITNIQSFEIYGFAKYERNNVEAAIPRQAIENSTAFKWEKKTLFLRVLVEGGLSLYSYEGGYTSIYFYKSNSDSLPIQLKHRISEAEGKINTDNTFINQLNFLSRNCQNLPSNEVERTLYRKDDLIHIFVKMNECQKAPFVLHLRKQQQLFKAHLAINGGAVNSNLNVRYGVESFYGGFYNYKSGSKTGFRVGATFELESIVYCKNFSAIVESYYQNFSDEKQLGGTHSLTIKLSGVHVNLGVRRYFPLNKQSSLFVNAFLGLHTFGFDPTLEYDYLISNKKQPEYIAKVRTFGDFTVGGGYRFNRFGAELRYNIPHGIAANNKEWHSSYSSLQAIVSVRLF
jgi:hypothetical protein